MSAPRCDSCGFVLAELDGHLWCINHKCDKFEPHMQNRKDAE